MRRRSLPQSLGLVLVLAATAACGGEEAEEPATTPSTEAPAAPAPSTPAPAAAGGDVAMGQEVFHGAGICFTCHGQAGVGTPLGPNLTDDTWLWVDSPEPAQLVEIIRTGVPTPREAPAPMPPMGGATLTDEQLNGVAAYVASL